MSKKDEIIKLVKENKIEFIALQFVDFLGKLYSLWIPSGELDSKIEEGEGISGWPYFAPVEKSDIILKPDLDSFRILPWRRSDGNGFAGVMCDMYWPDTLEEVKEAPRTLLKNAIRNLKQSVGEDVDVYGSTECEFFLLTRSEDGQLHLHDGGSYFSSPPSDKGFQLREDICHNLNEMGIKTIKNHHEAPKGKHEIIVNHDEALKISDKIQYVKLVIRKMASDVGLIATFMPKPFDWEYGAGWHTHLSLMNQAGKNLFFSKSSDNGISELGLHYIAGVLNNARGLAAITNPTVNSYKRLVPGSQAPIYVAWSKYNRSALLRIPPGTTSKATRFEYRASDGSCNTYLSFAALIHAGLDGIKKGKLPPPPVDQNIYELTEKERAEKGIKTLPSNLGEALAELKKNKIICNAINPLTDKYINSKNAEWKEYSYKVYDWEREKYLDDSDPVSYLKFK